ncbi:D-2-hydroxyacid dehydrogenase [Microlunatus soli]|uniref:Phosphoglycerate dehydrogenase n=1 Tax=Microlunatus soli TaxID=630515 RepID=A0A1H1UCQ8_9ACTN|nr:D-2-hydroxyacid dehydrogenase [Microlunatus soli]SDS70208.1 Phosphoglycerate dehydrogenase [Microlunatus soli]
MTASPSETSSDGGRERLRAVIAVPLPDDLVELIRTAEPRLEVVSRPDLTPPTRHPADWGGDPAFRRSPEQQAEFDRLVDDADILFGVPDVDADALSRTVAANPRLRWVHTTAAGGGASVKAAGLTDEALQRIAFTSSAGVHGSTLAEFAVFGIFAGAKDLPRLLRQQADREWPGRWAMRQVDELTVLVVGLGGIGKVVAAKLSALGATVLGTSRSGEPVDGVSELVAMDDLAEAASRADAIVVTLPGTDQTTGLIGQQVFDAAPDGVIIVNVGRGTVIDEDAMIAALNSGRIGFAALDVFAVEPLPADSPLWQHPNVLISPHTAALNPAEERRIAELFADNATRLLDNQPLRNPINTHEFY